MFKCQMIALRSGQGDVREEAEKLKEQLSDMSGWKEKVRGQIGSCGLASSNNNNNTEV